MILTPKGVTFQPVVVIGLGKNLLFKSVLGHCEMGINLFLHFVREVGSYHKLSGKVVIWRAIVNSADPSPTSLL